MEAISLRRREIGLYCRRRRDRWFQVWSQEGFGRKGVSGHVYTLLSDIIALTGRG